MVMTHAHQKTKSINKFVVYILILGFLKIYLSIGMRTLNK